MSLGIDKMELCHNLESFIGEHGWSEAVISLRQAFQIDGSFLLKELDIALRNIQHATPKMLLATSKPNHE